MITALNIYTVMTKKQVEYASEVLLRREARTRGRRPRALREGNARGLLFEDLESTTQLRINLELFQNGFSFLSKKRNLNEHVSQEFFPAEKGKNCPS